ncbi:Fic family protein [Verrucomicrobiales bacterium BCK34]|nr:Fic family protein [Verrucomicrobiales bacterium BCK34]
MPKQISAQELDAITAVIRRHPHGVGAEGIRGGLASSLSNLSARTLQRRLNRLEADGEITSTGTGKGKRYFPVSVEGAAAADPGPYPAYFPKPAMVMSPEYGDETIPLSDAGMEIRSLVRSPLIARTPVGYDSAFLGSYIPNETFYLPEKVREEFAHMGEVGVSDLPAGTYLRKILNRLLIDLSWNSSRLEGNTYSLLETQRLLSRGESAGGKNPGETQMILNHKAAIEMLADQASEIGFNRYTICNLHALLADGLIADQAACGRPRSCAVGIGGTVFHPLEVPQLIEERFQEILTKAETISDPFEQSFFAMVHLPYLQPFEDVNKRLSRIAANIPLVRSNLCPLSFIDVPQSDYVNGIIGVYELNRVDYLRDVFIWAYKRSASRYGAVIHSLGQPDPFRLRFRSEIGEFVREVVVGKMDKGEAARWIASRAGDKVGEANRVRFIEVVEMELLCLHEGNIARFRLRPGEFAAWEALWD